jgi:alpha-D-xyloside xylohydrolase
MQWRRRRCEGPVYAWGLLLVAPMFAGDVKRKVILPKGKWYDFYTGKLAGEGA